MNFVPQQNSQMTFPTAWIFDVRLLPHRSKCSRLNVQDSGVSPRRKRQANGADLKLQVCIVYAAKLRPSQALSKNLQTRVR
jgi:hypothetical protein